MVKRIACALVWLFAVAWAFNYVAAYTGLPQIVGGVIASAAAVFVAADPFHKLWPARVSAPTAASVTLSTGPIPNAHLTAH